jgi:hypothetical protein
VQRKLSDLEDAQLCLVCLDESKSVGVLHNGMLRLCLCSACAGQYDLARGCPVCRRDIEQMLAVY